jgi:hypothetical protein
MSGPGKMVNNNEAPINEIKVSKFGCWLWVPCYNYISILQNIPLIGL